MERQIEEVLNSVAQTNTDPDPTPIPTPYTEQPWIIRPNPDNDDNNCGNSLYHYTDSAGLAGIVASMSIKPSLHPYNARFGRGQYFTDIAPEQIGGINKSEMTQQQNTNTNIYALSQLSAKLFNIGPSDRRLRHFVEICVDQLPIVYIDEPLDRHIYLHKSELPLDIHERLVRYGDTPFHPENQ